jgi:hypothetical protein
VPSITSVIPTRVVEGGRVALAGSDLPTEVVPAVVVGGEPARTLFSSASKIVIDLPEDIEGGPTPVRIESIPGETIYLSVGSVWATGLHQVDNPVFDRAGNLFVTYSGSRGQESPVSVFRVTPAGTREPFVSGIVNATSLAIGPDGYLYVSSRFEGAVYRVKDDGSHEQVATDLGVACGLAFGADGSMYVGDRSGTIFRVRDGKATTFATLPPSVAANCSSADRRSGRTTTSTASIAPAKSIPCPHRSAARRDWRSRPTAHCMSSMRSQGRAGCIGFHLSIRNPNWSSPAALSSASHSGPAANSSSPPTTASTASNNRDVREESEGREDLLI